MTAIKTQTSPHFSGVTIIERVGTQSGIGAVYLRMQYNMTIAFMEKKQKFILYFCWSPSGALLLLLLHHWLTVFNPRMSLYLTKITGKKDPL